MSKMNQAEKPDSLDTSRPWYAEVTWYHWMVLAIASAGWVFDVYEGQIFNLTRADMLADILQSEAGSSESKKWGEWFLGIFLLGGTIGGIGFGNLADRYGRRPILVVTILMYSVFSGLTFFADSLWQVAILRFLVAMGVGGEWAVAASLVAEVFPKRARAQASGIFHSSSVLGTWAATLVSVLVASQWRYAYLIGILPAFLILWVRASVKEPERWQEQRKLQQKSMGSFRDLLLNPKWGRRAVLGMLLAGVGLSTFWSVVIASQNIVSELLQSNGVTEQVAASKSKFAYGFVQTAGGGLGLLAFGPLCARFGRKPTFASFQLLAVVIVPIVCFAAQSYTQLLWLLPIYGFLTLGMHAGYAIYFPELFPTHLRATGTSFCFNGGRLLSVPIMIFSGSLKGNEDVDLRWAVTGLSMLFLLGVLIIMMMPETKTKDLAE